MRRNVWELGGDWADPILWYARGVAAMLDRPFADPLSWLFYAAIHGYKAERWQKYGYLNSPEPDSTTKDAFFEQCQHGTWFFLPWHRGYLWAFEATIRAEIIKLGGPADWALPYWNYFKPGQEKLPPAFASLDWPDRHRFNRVNPLFVRQRYGPKRDGDVYVPLDRVNLKALVDQEFVGVGSGGGTGFGGVDTGGDGWSHTEDESHVGGIELNPHDAVHVLVGNDDPSTPEVYDSLMADTNTAGLDPIFWLHHANIDRLWEVWHQFSSRISAERAGHKDPLDVKDWLKGPRGDRKFTMPMPDGTKWDYVPGDVTDLAKLGYRYDDVEWPLPMAHEPSARLRRLGASAAAVRDLDGAAVARGESVELVGANQGLLRIVGPEARTGIQLDPGVRRRVMDSLTAAAAATGSAPDRLYLNLENVRSRSDAPFLQVYIGVQEDDTSAESWEHLVGGVGLFGVRSATEPDGDHAGQGVTFVLDATEAIDNLHLTEPFPVTAPPAR
jgi:tyrosinase